eukprot:CAMPEP_0202707978 /NCGR_PEP_ID=MMETSP1385-20130828/20250_1 /ASSEMBLY_ACC=CAM_ASM_000861 /TAXON_ID=933848 /ORGANISM="Elphidium margaritaceum" /LENGTH=228 /DNA_ID=CAMNT_0049366835 /DNA_START=28 /DNA_END=714 /DNA_ORIENTATION=-
MTTISDRMNIFYHLPSQTANHQALYAKINFFGILGSTAFMVYFYKLSIGKEQIERRYGEDFVAHIANYCRYASFACGGLALYHFLLYPRYPLKEAEQNLNIPSQFGLSSTQRRIIASCIAIPAIIVELLGWKEAKSTPLNVTKIDHQKQMFGGIYDYVRHPIYFCEFSWMYTLSLLLDSPFLLAVSAVVMQPACYVLCKYDEQDAIHHFGESYKKYCKRTAFWIPNIF